MNEIYFINIQNTLSNMFENHSNVQQQSNDVEVKNLEKHGWKSCWP